MVLRIAGRRLSLWRAVDTEGEVLDIRVQRQRDKNAVKLTRKLLTTQGFAPAVIVTDKLRSYGLVAAELTSPLTGDAGGPHRMMPRRHRPGR